MSRPILNLARRSSEQQRRLLDSILCTTKNHTGCFATTATSTTIAQPFQRHAFSTTKDPPSSSPSDTPKSGQVSKHTNKPNNTNKPNKVNNTNKPNNTTNTTNTNKPNNTN